MDIGEVQQVKDQLGSHGMVEERAGMNACVSASCVAILADVHLKLSSGNSFWRLHRNNCIVLKLLLNKRCETDRS